MFWFILTNWAFLAALIFVVLASRRTPEDNLAWTAVLCALWPILLLFFLLGSGLWLFGSIHHAIRRQLRR